MKYGKCCEETSLLYQVPGCVKGKMPPYISNDCRVGARHYMQIGRTHLSQGGPWVVHCYLEDFFAVAFFATSPPLPLQPRDVDSEHAYAGGPPT